MNHEDNQPELKRYRSILVASIEYFLNKEAGRIKWDQFDPTAQYYHKLKRNAEKYYKNNKLEKLKKLLDDIIEQLKMRGDLSFDRYIKEKTDYDIDIFGNIQERIDKIIVQKEIRNETEYYDVLAMMNVYRQTTDNQEKLAIVNKLRLDFDERNDKSKPLVTDNFFSNKLSEIYSPDGKYKLTVSESGISESNASTSVFLNGQKAGASVYAANGLNLDIKAYWTDNRTIVIETKKHYEVVSGKCKQIQIINDIFNIKLIEY